MRTVFKMRIGGLLIKSIIGFIIILFSNSEVITQNIVWEKSYTSAPPDFVSRNSIDAGNSVLVDNQNNIYIVGNSGGGAGNDKSQDSYLHSPNNSFAYEDFWIIKTNSLGDKIWDKTIGGSNGDIPKKIIQTNDGNILIAGVSGSNISPDKSENAKGTSPLSHDYWLVKLDPNGNKIWDKTIGGELNEVLTDVIQLPNGNYMVSGYSYSGISGDKSQPNLGEYDMWIVYLTSNGTKIWDRTYGGTARDAAQGLLYLQGDRVVVSGWSNSPQSATKTENNINGSFDYWVLALDLNGSIVWQNTIGGPGNDGATDIAMRSNEILIVGTSSSGIGNDKQAPILGGEDIWVVAITNLGVKTWDRTFGGGSNEFWPKIVTNNSDIYIGCTSISVDDFDKCRSMGVQDYWVIKLASNNDILWEEEFGGNSSDELEDIFFMNNSLFAIGNTGSGQSIDKANDALVKDYWLLKITTNDVDCCYGDPSQLFALREFFTSTNGNSWTNKSGWNTNCEYCTWFGVTCDAQQNVIGLNFWNNNLSGTIPNSLCELTHLETLIIRQNKVTGPIPTCIGQMSSLKWLQLNDNKFSGTIPEFSNTPNLTYLSLTTNLLTGTIPGSIGDLPLVNFSLGDNDLSGCFDPNLENLCGNPLIIDAGINNGNNFDALWSQFCQSGAGSCCSHADLQALRDFYNSTNGDQWTNTVANDRPWLVDCDPCGLVDGTPWKGIECDNMGRVDRIILQNNNLVGNIPSSLGQLTELDWFNVNNNKLTGSLPSEICNLSKMLHFVVSRNMLSGTFPPCIADLPVIARIVANNNKFAGMLPGGAAQPSLINLHFDNNMFTGGIPSQYANLPGLTYLSVSNNQLSGCYPPVLSTFCTNPNFTSNSNALISDGNNFINSWSLFCTGVGGCTVSTDDHNKAKYNIYPNPTNDVLTVDGDDFELLEILSINGIHQIRSEISSVDVSNLPTGIYLIRINGIYNYKLIKL